MKYAYLKANNKNTFYPVPLEEIASIEKELEIAFPKDLKDFYSELGYGFIKGSEFNINRFLDPVSLRDFRLRQNDFEYHPDIEIYTEFEQGKLIFFEVSESAYMSIGFEKNDNAIYYYHIKIAENLEEFIHKINENDRYYLEFI
jgi:hypothetical protein